jgi:hypothetical protein
MSQQWDAPGLLDLIDDPVVIADCFKGDRRSFRESGKERQDRSGFVIDPGLLSG